MFRSISKTCLRIIRPTISHNFQQFCSKPSVPLSLKFDEFQEPSRPRPDEEDFKQPMKPHKRFYKDMYDKYKDSGSEIGKYSYLNLLLVNF